ncbi:hypothetical protein PC118_g18037, partial [Phytophthora cactorum]
WWNADIRVVVSLEGCRDQGRKTRPKRTRFVDFPPSNNNNNHCPVGIYN